jgi:hypothetical protein
MILDKLLALADEQGTLFWKAVGLMHGGWLFALTGKAADAVQKITSGLGAWRSIGAGVWIPTFLSSVTIGYAELGQFDEAWRCSNEAMTEIEKNEGTVVGGRSPSQGWRNRA